MNMFQECSQLTKIKVPKYVKKIGMNTFANCSSLIEVTFEEPSSLLFISSYSFKNCKRLKRITIPSKVLMIGKNAFQNCTSLTEISVPSNTRIIDELSFDPLNIKRIQSEPIENDYYKALQKFVSILKIPELDMKNCIDDDEVLDHIVDAFKKFPCLFNEDQSVIMEKLSELGLEDEIKNYFSGFYYSFITLYVHLVSGKTETYTFKENDNTNILYDEMDEKFFDGINKITLFDLKMGKPFPRDVTFKDSRIDNFTTLNYTQTLLGF